MKMATVDTTWLVLHIYDCEVQIRCAVHSAYYVLPQIFVGCLSDLVRELQTQLEPPRIRYR